MKPIRFTGLVFAAVAAIACSAEPTGSNQTPPPGSDTIRIALSDLGTRTYKGFSGGLYPNGSNTMPSWHAAEGRRRATLIRPLDVNGNASANGRIVMVSFSMSNGTQEFCAGSGYTTCDSWSFMGRARADAAVNQSTLTIVNGARGGQVTAAWTSSASAEYDRIRDQGLTPLGLSERQVQVGWVKMANAQPRAALPNTDADAYLLHAGIGNVLRALKVRYPNMQMVFVSSRTYGGFATTTLNPEPYAYETGFGNKWVIEDQIQQTAPTTPSGPSRAGNLDYRIGIVPWVAWAAYLWAGDQDHRRSDGFFYERADFASDGTHPSTSGRGKVGDQLLNFFKTSEFTSCWFLAARTCN
jgi:hypothetical protein